MAVDRPVEVSNFNIANILTMIRIALVPVFVWLFLSGGTEMRLAAAILFLVAALTDKLDGDIELAIKQLAENKEKHEPKN